MKPSGSALFPFKVDLENDCLARAQTVEYTVLSAIRLFLVTRRGSRLGNPIGSFIPDLLTTLVPRRSLATFSAELRTELTNQFPGVTFTKVNLDLDLSNQTVDLIVSIAFSVYQDNLVQLEERLPSIFSSSSYAEREL